MEEFDGFASVGGGDDLEAFLGENADEGFAGVVVVFGDKDFDGIRHRENWLEWEKEAEVSAGVGGEEGEVALHFLGEGAGDGEADAGAGNAFGEGGVEAGEGSEDFGVGGAGDAGALVGEVDGELLAEDLGGEEGLFPGSGVFLDVGKEVADDLFDRVGVGEDGLVGREVGGDSDAGKVEGGLPMLEAGGEEGLRVEGLRVELELAAVGAREGEDVVDEAGEAAGLLVDDLERLRGGVVAVVEVLRGHLGIEADVGERGFELVADLVDEGDAAGGLAQGAVVLAVKPKGDDEEGGGESEEVEKDGIGEFVGALGNTRGVVVEAPSFQRWREDE